MKAKAPRGLYLSNPSIALLGVEVSGGELRLTERGRPFLRNATMFFDRRLRRQQWQLTNQSVRQPLHSVFALMR